MVTNKHQTVGTFGKDCSARIYWDFVRCEGSLLWKTLMDEPSKTSININPDMVIETPVPHRENRYDVIYEYKTFEPVLTRTKFLDESLYDFYG